MEVKTKESISSVILGDKSFKCRWNSSHLDSVKSELCSKTANVKSLGFRTVPWPKIPRRTFLRRTVPWWYFLDEHFPNEQFPEGLFPERIIPRTGILPTDSFPNDISRTNFSPNHIFFIYLNLYLPLVYKSCLS